jgi:tetratricopeptide (TPR) repeat protein
MGRQVFLASRRFFERLAQARPVVLVFEDLHWVDESSALLLEHLLPLVERVPLLICGVRRPYRETPAAHLREIAARDYASHYTEIELAPLSQIDSAQLVRNLLEIEDLSPQVREMIVRKAEGNPFFLEEIIRGLIDVGAVVRDSTTGRWQATAQIEMITIPDTIQGVIMARVDRLEEDVKQALKTASVIGRSFLYRVLRAVAEADRQLDQHLAELQAVELIREKQRVRELEYIFKHALAQEATYESILLQKRRALHARVGQALEALFAGRLEEFYSLLAYHYGRAEAWEKAQKYLLKAGNQAGRVAADAEALAHYEQAMVAYAHAFGDRWDPVQRAALERKMGEALFRQGEHAQALDYLQRALAYLGKPLPTSRWGVRLAILREIAQQIGHRLMPRLFLKPMGGPVSPAVEEEVRSYEPIAWIAGYTNPERFLLVALRMLNVAERNGFPYGAAVGSVGLGIISDLIPIFWLAESYHRRAVALAEQIQHPGALGRAYQGLEMHEKFLGKLDTAIDAALEEAIKLAEAIPDYVGCIWAGGVLGRCYLRQGQLGQALTALEVSQQVCVEHPMRGGGITIPLRNGLAEAYLLAAEQGDTLQRSEKADWLKKARRACRAALKEGKAYRPGLPEAMMLQGRYEWLRGKPATVQEWWQHSLALAEEMGQRYDLGMTLTEMGRRLGERAHLERAEAIFAEIGAEWDLARARKTLEGRRCVTDDSR